MSLFLHVGNRTEGLVDLLADRLLRHPLGDPLAREVVLVQSRGMQRWISLELAARMGVSANIRFPFPNAMVSELFAMAFDIDAEALGRSRPEVMAWQVMALLSELVPSPPFAPLRRYLSLDNAPLRLFQLSGRIADTFDQYTLYRPEMLEAWEREEEPGEWQAILWRRLSASWQGLHRASLRRRFAAMEGWEGMGFPERIALFGIPYLPQFHLDILSSVARSIDVDLYLLSPSAEYWGDIVSRRAMARMEGGERLFCTEGNPLLASLGTLGRDFSESLIDFAGDALSHDEHYEDPGTGTLLHALQSDMLALRGTGDGLRHRLDPDDRSVQVHSCHGRLREVEVLHDNLLRLFESIEGLKPREVVVMAADIEAYAPYISAVFDDPGNIRIPFTIADRRLLNEGEAASAFLRLLALRQSRMGGPELFDLLSSPPVQRRFGLHEESLELVRQWIVSTRIRWGVDERDRHAQQMPAYRQNTWRAGIDRLLLGYAMPEETELFGGILPFGDLDSSSAVTLGLFADFIDAIDLFSKELLQPRTPAAWSLFLLDVLERFIETDEASEPEMAALRALCEGIATTSEGYRDEVPTEVMAAWIESRLERHEQGLGFMRAGVTFCAMLPMRSIPFRVVALLGMDEGAFPRQDQPAGFDLVALHPRRGDRSLRAEDRYLFLETILSARDCLYISYRGQGVRDNARTSPSVLVSELLDAIDRGFILPSGKDAAALLTMYHRLQPFSAAYFSKEGPWFSYADENFHARRHLAEASGGKGGFIDGPVPYPAPEGAQVDIDDLLRFYDNPSRYFLRKRLLLRDPALVEPLDMREPFSLDGLEAYRLRERLVDALIEGVDPLSLEERFRAEGVLPPEQAGRSSFLGLLGEAESFVGRLRAYAPDLCPLAPEPIALAVGPFVLTGSLQRLTRSCQLYRTVGSTRPALLMRAWISHLVLLLGGREDLPAGTCMVSRKDAVSFGSIDDPMGLLEPLLAGYFEGLTMPMPWFPRSSFAWAGAIVKGEGAALKAARMAWKTQDFSGTKVSGEGEDPAYLRCFDGAEPFGPRFRILAESLAGPLLSHAKKLK